MIGASFAESHADWIQGAFLCARPSTHEEAVASCLYQIDLYSGLFATNVAGLLLASPLFSAM